MKSKTLTATVQRFSMIGAQHWYAVFSDHKIRSKKFWTYRQARRYAILYVYAKNITVYD